MSLPTPVREPITPEKRTEPDWTRGWRYETVRTANGKEETIQVPLRMVPISVRPSICVSALKIDRFGWKMPIPVRICSRNSKYVKI